MDADDTVVIAKKETCLDGDDPVIGKFLSFVARDMVHKPGRIRRVPKSPVSRAKADEPDLKSHAEKRLLGSGPR